jgi:hypothetical protein
MAISLWYVNIISSYRPSIEQSSPTGKGGSEAETPSRKVATLHTYLLGEPSYSPQYQSLGQLASDPQSRTDTAAQDQNSPQMAAELATHPSSADRPPDSFPFFTGFNFRSPTVPSQVPAAAVVHHGYGESLGPVMMNKL